MVCMYCCANSVRLKNDLNLVRYTSPSLRHSVGCGGPCETDIAWRATTSPHVGHRGNVRAHLCNIARQCIMLLART